MLSQTDLSAGQAVTDTCRVSLALSVGGCSSHPSAFWVWSQLLHPQRLHEVT